MVRYLTNLLRAACFLGLWFSAFPGVGQTVAPPIAEYRGKIQGMFELKNDGDVPLAVILEVHGFQVSEQGNILYGDLDPAIRVELGESSFVIPPHGSHFVFYKARVEKDNAWFTILSTLTKAASDANRMRINFVLPHVVYLYQKPKLKKEDVEVAVLPGTKPGEYTLAVQNHSAKLGRVEGVTWQGCETKGEYGGFPMFPSGKRLIPMQTGTLAANASVKVTFQDGFSVQVPMQ